MSEFKFTQEERNDLSAYLQGYFKSKNSKRAIDFIEQLISARDNSKHTDEVASVPYQLCPKCNGQGQVAKPPYIAGDVHTWSSSQGIYECDVCNGSKIIPMLIISS